MFTIILLIVPCNMVHGQQVRRLMTRFHDNPQLLRAKADAKGKHAGVGHLFGHHGGSDEPFDPMRGQRTRVKHGEDWTTEEIEWMSIDKVVLR